MRKFKTAEKVIIATLDNNYTAYDCEQHGVFINRKDVDDSKCPYGCEGKVFKIENIIDLKEKFSRELNLLNITKT